MDEDFKILNTEEINIILAERLKYCREKSGLTLREVAEKIGKSPGQVSLWEKGANPPNCIDLFKLCVTYNIILPDLFPGLSDKLKPTFREEIYLVRKYRAADPEVKITIQKILEYTQKGQGK